MSRTLYPGTVTAPVPDPEQPAGPAIIRGSRPPGRTAAFFDLDRTLIAGSSGLHWARAARRAGMLGRRQMARLAVESLQFRLQGSTDESTQRVREQAAKMLDGARRRDLARMAPQVLEGVLPRVYPQMLEAAYAHQDAGRPVFICTAASQDLADMLAMVLGFDGAIGTRFELRGDDSYTGHVVEPPATDGIAAVAARHHRGGSDVAAEVELHAAAICPILESPGLEFRPMIDRDERGRWPSPRTRSST